MNNNTALLLGAISSALSPILIALYIKGGQKQIILIILAIINSLVILYFYWYLGKKQNMSSIYTKIKILAIIMVVITGIVIIGDKITYRNVIGIILAVIAMKLLQK